MLGARVGHGLGAVALGEHDHAAAERLEEIDVAVHAAGCSGSETTGCVADGGLGGAGVVDGVVFEVVGQALAGVDAFLELGVGDVARDDERAGKEHAGGDGVPGELGANGIHGLVQVDADGLVVLDLAQLGREEAAGVELEFLEEDAVLGDLGLDVAIGGAGDAHADGEGGAVAGQADDADVEGEVFAAELGADAGLARDVQDPGLPFEVAEGAAVFVAGGRQRIVIAGGGEFEGLHRRLGGGAADDEDEVVGRAGGGAEVAQFVRDEFLQARRGEDSAGFLKEEHLVGRAAALGDE